MAIDEEIITRRCRRISEIEKRLRILASLDKSEFLDNPEMVAAAERYLQIASQAMADISNHLIARNNWGTPETYRDSIKILEKNGVITQALSNHLEELMGLRNILVHDYLATEPTLLLNDLKTGLPNISKFVKLILQYLEDRI